MCAAKRADADADGLGQHGTCIRQPAAAGEHGHARERAAVWLVADQRLTERGERERAADRRIEHTEARQRTHQALEIPAVRAAPQSELVERQWSRRERFGYPELDRDADRLRNRTAQDQPDHASTVVLLAGCQRGHLGRH